MKRRRTSLKSWSSKREKTRSRRKKSRGCRKVSAASRFFVPASDYVANACILCGEVADWTFFRHSRQYMVCPQGRILPCGHTMYCRECRKKAAEHDPNNYACCGCYRIPITGGIRTRMEACTLHNVHASAFVAEGFDISRPAEDHWQLVLHSRVCLEPCILLGIAHAHGRDNVLRRDLISSRWNQPYEARDLSGALPLLAEGGLEACCFDLLGALHQQLATLDPTVVEMTEHLKLDLQTWGLLPPRANPPLSCAVDVVLSPSF